MTNTTTLPTLDDVNAIITDRRYQFLDRLPRNGFYRTILERANSRHMVETEKLADAVKWANDAYAEMARRGRAKKLAGQVKNVQSRPWFARFAEANPETAERLQKGVDRNATHNQMDALKADVDQAFEWSREDYSKRQAKHEAFVEQLLERRGRVMSQTREMGEFAHANPVAHGTVCAGLTDRSDRQAVTQLKEAVKAYYSWLHGPDAATLRMGLGSGQKERKGPPATEVARKARIRANSQAVRSASKSPKGSK